MSTATPDYTIANSDVVSKYKAAGEISQLVLAEIKKLAVPGSSVFELCSKGDELILEETSKVYNLKKNKVSSKGIGFPTCVSPNNISEYLSPISSEEKEGNYILKQGDLVKIHLGAQIDGFSAAVAETFVCGEETIKPGKAADVISAAYYATEAAIRLIRENKKNYDVTKTVDAIASEFGTTPLEGMLSKIQERNKPFGDKEIILNPTEEQKKQVSALNFHVGEVYGLDILISSSKEGKAKPTEIKTTVFCLTGLNTSLKLKASRAAFLELKSHSENFPVSSRSFKDPSKGRMGYLSCVNNGVMHGLDVVAEKPDELIAQFFCTVGLTKNGVVKLSYPNFDISKVESSHKIQDEKILALLKEPLKNKKSTK